MLKTHKYQFNGFANKCSMEKPILGYWKKFKKKKNTQILHLMLPGCITAWSWESSATIHAQMFEFGDIHYL